MKRSAAIMATAVAIGCGPDDAASADPPIAAFEAALGGARDPMFGAGGFVEVEDGADLPLRPGSQGGLHVFLNLRVSAETIRAASDKPILYREGRRVRDGKLVSRIEYHDKLVAVDGGYETENSIRMFLCPVAIGVDVADELIEVTVDVKPDYDAEPVARGKLRFVPRCVSGDDEAFCQQICYWR